MLIYLFHSAAAAASTLGDVLHRTPRTAHCIRTYSVVLLQLLALHRLHYLHAYGVSLPRVSPPASRSPARPSVRSCIFPFACMFPCLSLTHITCWYWCNHIGSIFSCVDVSWFGFACLSHLLLPLTLNNPYSPVVHSFGVRGCVSSEWFPALLALWY